PRVMGLAFAVETPSAELCNKFIAERFKHGLLYYPAGDRTLRFRLNIAFSASDLEFLFHELDVLCNKIFNNVEAPLPSTVESKERGVANLYDWHKLLLSLKIDQFQGKLPDSTEAWNKIVSLFKEATTHD